MARSLHYCQQPLIAYMASKSFFLSYYEQNICIDYESEPPRASQSKSGPLGQASKTMEYITIASLSSGLSSPKCIAVIQTLRDGCTRLKQVKGTSVRAATISHSLQKSSIARSFELDLKSSKTVPLHFGVLSRALPLRRNPELSISRSYAKISWCC